MKINHKTLVVQVFKFINKILFFEKKTTFHYQNVTIFPTELHLILFLHEEQKTNVTRIAKQLGVTKGAISQTLSRLEKKGILRKTKDPYQKNELTVEFTATGKAVLKKYLQITTELHQQYDKYLSALTDNDRVTISGFLSHAEVIMDKLINKKYK